MNWAKLLRVCGSVATAIITCAASPPPLPPTPLGPAPPAVVAVQAHLSADEARELAIIRWIHEGRGIIQRFRESGALADSVEWIVPGPPDILPFAGSWHGLSGIEAFQAALDRTMRYDRVELREYLVSGSTVGAIFTGEGIARATGRPFHSDIFRLYTFDSASGRIVRVQNFYDTHAYVAAVRPMAP